jgi:hypothetical protein
LTVLNPIQRQYELYKSNQVNDPFKSNLIVSMNHILAKVSIYNLSLLLLCVRTYFGQKLRTSSFNEQQLVVVCHHTKIGETVKKTTKQTSQNHIHIHLIFIDGTQIPNEIFDLLKCESVRV